MAKIMHNPSVEELLEAIRLEDLGVTYKATTKDIVKLPEVKSQPFGTEHIAMQMAVEQCNKLANMLQC